MTCFGGSSSSTNTDDPSRQWGNYVLDTTSQNVYIRMGDPTGRRVVSYQQRDHITRAVPQLAQQLTGSPYRGRIESGIEDRDRTGWITVRFVTQEEEPEISDGNCGRARVGGDPGSIWDHPAGARGTSAAWIRSTSFQNSSPMSLDTRWDSSTWQTDPRSWPLAFTPANPRLTRPSSTTRAWPMKWGGYTSTAGWPFSLACATQRRFQLRGVAPIVID